MRSKLDGNYLSFWVHLTYLSEKGKAADSEARSRSWLSILIYRADLMSDPLFWNFRGGFLERHFHLLLFQT